MRGVVFLGVLGWDPGDMKPAHLDSSSLEVLFEVFITGTRNELHFLQSKPGSKEQLFDFAAGKEMKRACPFRSFILADPGSFHQRADDSMVANVRQGSKDAAIRLQPSSRPAQ